METIKIPQASRRHARTFIGLSALIALSSIAILYLPNAMVSLVASFGIILAYIGMRVGFSKLHQPRYGLVICHDHLQFHHRYGGWAIVWKQIQRIGIPSVGRGFERRDLGYIGIRLNDYTHLLDTLSPRLCAHLLTEQRAALLVALRQDCPSGTCPSDHLLEDDYFTDTKGRCYHGLLAMFANRMSKLRDMTGYDLFIDQDALSNHPEHFVSLARQYLLAGMRADL
ncbi:DUF2982 domain-containing protein [Celerinatantimonas yamalensis]|uniref:DUF2982 domain-containing protein n=1 Tax=Celerinatantimonas yamalensis TaxID=559956 RepID=A0ABW9G2J6_9GAMM